MGLTTKIVPNTGETGSRHSLPRIARMLNRYARSVALAGLLGILLLIALVPSGQTAKPAATPTARASTSAAVASPSPVIGASPSVGPSGTPATIRTAVAEIGHVVWATSLEPGTNAPRQRVTSFPVTAATIYAVVPIAWIKQGTTITATWSYNATLLTAFTTTATIPAEERELWLEFHLDRGKLTSWPSGTLVISIAIDGKTVTSAQVTVGTADHS